MLLNDDWFTKDHVGYETIEPSASNLTLFNDINHDITVVDEGVNDVKKRLEALLGDNLENRPAVRMSLPSSVQIERIKKSVDATRKPRFSLDATVITKSKKQTSSDKCVIS